MKRPDHSTATTAGGLPTVEEAMKGAADADAALASDLAGLVYEAAQGAINELAITGDPHLAEAAAHLVTALFEIGQAGRPVEADEPVAVEEVEPKLAPETTLEDRHPRPWSVTLGMGKWPTVHDANGVAVAVGCAGEKLALIAAYNREPLFREIAQAAEEATAAWIADRHPIGARLTRAHDALNTLLHRLPADPGDDGGDE